ncbi:MAG: hypothetical protein LWW86_01815 [Micrococcales bacterium]|nr:hypothetical protein [Micrococcales bacterium]
MWEADTRSDDAPTPAATWDHEARRGRSARRGGRLPQEVEEFLVAQWGPLRTIALAVTADPHRAGDAATDVGVATAREWEEASEAGHPREWVRRRLIRRLLTDDEQRPAARTPLQRHVAALTAYDALPTADRLVLALAVLDGQVPETALALVRSERGGREARPLAESWAGHDLTDLREALDTEISRAGDTTDPVAGVAVRVAGARRRRRRVAAAIGAAAALALAWPVAAQVRELRPEPAPSPPTSQARRDAAAWTDVTTWPARGNVPAARVEVGSLPPTDSVGARRVLYAQDLPQGRVVVTAGELLALDSGGTPQPQGPPQSLVEVFGGPTGTPAARLRPLGSGVTQPGEAPRVVFAGVLAKGQPCMALVLTPPSHHAAQLSIHPEITTSGNLFRHWKSVPLSGGVWSGAVGESTPIWMRVKTVGGDGPAIGAGIEQLLQGTNATDASLSTARRAASDGLGVPLEKVPGSVQIDSPIPPTAIAGIVGTGGPLTKANLRVIDVTVPGGAVLRTMQVDFESKAESGGMSPMGDLPLPSASSPVAITGYPAEFSGDSALPPPRPTLVIAPGARTVRLSPAVAGGPSGTDAVPLTPVRVGGKTVPGLWTTTLSGELVQSGFTMTATDAAGRETTRTQREGDDSDPMDLYPAF